MASRRRRLSDTFDPRMREGFIAWLKTKRHKDRLLKALEGNRDSTDRKLLYQLGKLEEEWVLSYHKGLSPVQEQYQLAWYCFNQHLHKETISYLEAAEKLIGQLPQSIHNAEYAWRCASLRLQIAEKLNEWDHVEALFAATHSAQQHFLLLEQADLGCRMLYINVLGSTPALEKKVDIIADFLQLNVLEHPSQLAVLYTACFKMLHAPTDLAHYFRLKELLLTIDLKQVSKGDFETIFSFYKGYITARVNQGDLDFEKELLESFRFAIDNHIFYEDEHLPFAVYINAAAIALRQKEYEWAHHFIENKYQNILPEERDSAYAFTKGLYSYFTDQLEDAMMWFSKVRFEHAIYKLHTRHMQLKTAYKLRNEDLMEAQANSLKLFLYRNKGLYKNHRESFNNFLRFFLQLQTAKKRGPNKLAKLRGTINSHPLLADKKWLLQEIDNLLAEKAS
ncbi:MAG: hypothetical protein SFW35_07360 [Chitinophagales bacterium]|nr:hypothetical protein [Chitinophagales bacterium]